MSAKLLGWLFPVMLVIALMSSARANETTIATMSLATLPEATTIEIRLPVEEGSDDLPLSVTLASEFAILLTELGYTTVERGGELIFRFVSEEPTYAQRGSDRRHTNLPAESSLNRKRSARTHGVLTLASQITVAQDAPDTFRLRVSVARPKRPPLWTGFIVRSIGGAERRETYLSMAKEIMRHWGKNHQE
jgi:hypothetical protein